MLNLITIKSCFHVKVVWKNKNNKLKSYIVIFKAIEFWHKARKVVVDRI